MNGAKNTILICSKNGISREILTLFLILLRRDQIKSHGGSAKKAILMIFKLKSEHSEEMDVHSALVIGS